MSRSRRWMTRLLVVLLPLLLVVSLGLFVFTRCHPPALVQVVLRNVPPDTESVHMAAMAEPGAVEMEWRPPASFDVRDHYMPNFQIPRVIEQSATEGFRFRVLWVDAPRYGVVLLNQQGEWRVTWFPAAEVPIQGRNWFGGEGRAEFDLSKAEIVPLDADTVKALGLQDVKPFPK